MLINGLVSVFPNQLGCVVNKFVAADVPSSFPMMVVVLMPMHYFGTPKVGYFVN